MKFEKPLFELPPAPPDMPDPVHNEHDLWRGIDAAERFGGLTLDDIKLVFQYRRPAAIGILSRIGAELDDRTFCKAAWLAGHRMQFDQLKRREFITLLGGAAAAWPLAARAQLSVVGSG